MISRVATKVVARSLTGGVSIIFFYDSKIIQMFMVFVLDPWPTF